MRTEEILNIDCRKEEGKKKINSFLWKIKPVTKLKISKGCMLTVEDIEKVLHGISIHYDYIVQQIAPYYEDGEQFVFFKGEVMRKRNKTNEWCGTVYGKTMWELLAKALIKMYSEIKKEKTEE